MKLVYIAGPYRGKTPMITKQNILNAEIVAARIVNNYPYHFPVTPHLCTGGFEHTTNGTDEYFLTGTMELLRRCDMMALIPGWEKSEGSREEALEALKLKIPIFDEWMILITEKVEAEVGR